MLVYIVCLPTCPYFLTYLLPYLSFLRMDPFRFQAGYRKRRLNLALAFLCLFRVVVQRLMNACFCCVRFCFFPFQAKRLAWGNVSRNDLFRIEWYVKPRLNQSIYKGGHGRLRQRRTQALVGGAVGPASRSSKIIFSVYCKNNMNKTVGCNLLGGTSDWVNVHKIINWCEKTASESVVLRIL